MTQGGLYEEVIIAGFGGQGIILAGKLLAQTTMLAGKETTFMPSYGAEMRGGTANSMVIIADEPVASPLVTNPNSLIAMNKASLHKFAPRVKKDGLILLNSSLVDIESEELIEGVQIVSVPVDDIATKLGSGRSANMVAVGAYLQSRGIFDTQLASQALPAVLAKRYHNTLGINTKAIEAGAEYAGQLMQKT